MTVPQLAAPVLTGAQRETLAAALSDAITYRRPGGPCSGNCEPVFGEYCYDHADDADRAGEYAALAHELGIEVPAG